jgi:hypothetical protein
VIFTSSSSVFKHIVLHVGYIKTGEGLDACKALNALAQSPAKD